jgi:hypothetical protein
MVERRYCIATHLSREECRAFDAMRGDTPRSTKIRELIQEACDLPFLKRGKGGRPATRDYSEEADTPPPPLSQYDPLLNRLKDVHGSKNP